MVNFFEEKNTLNKLAYFAFSYAGLMNKEDNKWLPLFTYYQLGLHIAVIATIIELFEGSREVQDIVEALSILITVSFASIRALRFISMKKEIINILDRLETLRLKMHKDYDNKEFIVHAENIGRKILSSIFLSLNSFPIVTFFSVTFCDYFFDFKEKHLVLKVWIPWSRENVWVNILTNALLSTIIHACSSFFSAIHFVEFTFTLYVSAYIKSLQNNLINKGIRNEEIYEHHKVIIQLIKDHNKILSGIKYFETQISPLMPCGFGYTFIKAIKKNEINVAVDNYLRAILCLFPSFITCFCGQQIISQMEQLHEATYMSNWYKEEPKFRKDLLTMMIRTTNPPTINYRLFIKFDHVLLSLVLQTTYSYLMLMVNLDTE